MPFVLRKSALDPALFEIVDGEEVVQEIPIGFRLFKIPRQFGSIQEIKRWVEEEEKRLAKGTAYRLLGIRSQSEAELKRKLSRRGFSLAVIVDLIEALRRLGFISDASLERALIEKECRRGHGPRYIEMKLRSLGLDSAQVRKTVAEDAQREAIRKLIPKLKNPAAALQRRGFDLELILSELKNSIYSR